MTHPAPWKSSFVHNDDGRPVWFILDGEGKRVCICTSAVAADIIVQLANKYTITLAALKAEAEETRAAAERVARRADALERGTK